ncbi:phage terminase small subunit P27 family [Paraburkholderia pallida]|nr:phage terminase small subunit P27 family [Paraburkholderia pallida]
MSRQRKPTALHVIDGTYRADRAPRKTMKPSETMPSAPAHVQRDPLAYTEWRRLAKVFAGMGVITPLDRGALAIVCMLWARVVQADNVLAKMAARDPNTHGLIVMTTNGNAIQNPLVGTANRAMLMYLRACREFGMTPAARAGIEMAPDVPASGKPSNGYF